MGADCYLKDIVEMSSTEFSDFREGSSCIARLYRGMLTYSLFQSGRYKDLCNLSLKEKDAEDSAKFCRIYALLKMGLWKQAYNALLPFLADNPSEDIEALAHDLRLKVGIELLANGRVNQGLRLLKEVFTLGRGNKVNQDLFNRLKANPYSRLYFNERRQVLTQWEDERKSDLKTPALTHRLALFYYEWAKRQENCILEIVTIASNAGIPYSEDQKWDKLLKAISKKNPPQPCFRKKIQQNQCLLCDREIICWGDITEPTELWVNSIMNWAAVVGSTSFWKEFIDKRSRITGIKFSDEDAEKAKERVLREFTDLMNKYLDKYGELGATSHSRRFNHYIDLLRWECNTAKVLGKVLTEVNTQVIPEGFYCGALLLDKLSIKDSVIKLINKLEKYRDAEIIGEAKILLSEYGLAYSCIKNGRYRSALEHLEVMKKGIKESDEWKKLASNASLEWGLRESADNFNLSEELLLKVIIIGIQDQVDKARVALVNNYVLRGRKLLKNDPNEAVNFLTKAAESFNDPKLKEMLVGAHYKCGDLALGEKHLKLAIGHYKKSLGIDPGFSPAKKSLALALNNLGVEFANTGRTSEAIPKYIEALSYHAEAEYIKSNLAYGLLYVSREELQAGRCKQAKELVDEALSYLHGDEDFNKAAATALNNIGVRLGYSKKGLGIDCLRKAHQLDPNSQIILQNWNQAMPGMPIDIFDDSRIDDILHTIRGKQ